jgi:transcriptional regulator with XRE-family HTH domain
MADPYNSLAAYLEDTGTTQYQLAAKLGISTPAMSRIVRGLQMPNPQLAMDIQELTGVTIESLARMCIEAKSAAESQGLAS